MAYPVEVTLQVGNKVSLNYQSQEVGVCIAYRLERDDTDVLAVVEEKMGELVAAHELAWRSIKGERGAVPEVSPRQEVPEKLEQEGEVLASSRTATSSQASLIRALWRQSGKEEEELTRHLRTQHSCESVEHLSYAQAAALLVRLGREERERFEKERTH